MTPILSGACAARVAMTWSGPGGSWSNGSTCRELHLRHRSRIVRSHERRRWSPSCGHARVRCAFTTRDPLDGVTGTPVVANPYHYADNDPVNEVDPEGLRPQDPDLRPKSPKPDKDVYGPDCTGMGGAEWCNAIVEVLDRRYPTWRKFNVKVQGVSGSPGWNQDGVLYIGQESVRTSWRTGGTYSFVAPEVDLAFEHVVLHELGHSAIFPFTYGGKHKDVDVPSIYDRKKWAKTLSGGNDADAAAILSAINSFGGSQSLVDELLADCYAENYVPVTRGGYWIKEVGGPYSCTESGKALARRMDARWS